MIRTWLVGPAMLMSCVLVGVGIEGAGVAQTPETAASNAPAPPQPAKQALPNFDTRLAALTPSDPAAYFLLGEELAAEARDATDRTLARHLLVLAYELSQRHGATTTAPHDPRVPERLAASVCLALAAIAENDDQRAWLLAMAAVGEPEDAPGSGTASRVRGGIGEHVDEATAFDLATAIGLIRAGEGRLAIRLLDRPEIGSLLKKLEGLLTPTGGSGGADRLRRLAERYQFCAECRNRRWTKDSAGVHICATCNGEPGPAITDDEYLYQLRLESVLLGTSAGDGHDGEDGLRSWAAQVIVDQGSPLQELDMSRLAEIFGVDKERPLWRGGAWTSESRP